MIYGHERSTALYGGPGNDVLIGDAPGPERWRHGPSHDEIHGGAGDDRLIGFTGVDELYGGTGHDLLDGGGDWDHLYPGAGDDVVHGGTDEDSDTVVYDDAPGPVTIDLDAGTAQGHGTDRLEDVEDAAGSAFDDRLLGSAGPNYLFGGPGADYMDGRTGDDSLFPDMRMVRGDAVLGSPGNDVVEGGPGKDLVMMSPLDPSVPIEVDLTTGRAAGDGTDALSSIESLALGSYAGVRVIASDDDNLVYVYQGDGYVEALGGDDDVSVNSSRSEIDGGDGFDRCFSAEVVRNCERYAP